LSSQSIIQNAFNDTLPRRLQRSSLKDLALMLWTELQVCVDMWSCSSRVFLSRTWTAIV